MMMLSDYFPISLLETDLLKQLQWVTSYNVQKALIGYEGRDQLFAKDLDGNIVVHKSLLFQYKLYFDTDNVLEEIR